MKVRRSMAVDPTVWEKFQAEASDRRVSASWLLEELMREFLTIEKLAKTKGKMPRVPKLAATVEMSS